jgi:hypothetical protein
MTPDQLEALKGIGMAVGVALGIVVILIACMAALSWWADNSRPLDWQPTHADHLEAQRAIDSMHSAAGELDDSDISTDAAIRAAVHRRGL